MKKILMFLGVLFGVALTTPEKVQAQCGKCIVTSEDPYQAYCQRGPLAPPAQKDCEDRPDGSCWENSQSCYDELAVRAVDLSLSGVPLLAGTNVSILGSSTALRSCGGLVLAIRYEARAEAAIRTATDHLIV